MNKRSYASIDPESGKMETRDSLGWINDSDARIPAEDEIGSAWGDRIIVMPRVAPSMIGSIYVPIMAQEADDWLTYSGIVVSVGPLAFRSKAWTLKGMTEDQIPKHGEWVLFAQYQYQRLQYRDLKLLVLKEDSIIHRVPAGLDPREFRIRR